MVEDVQTIGGALAPDSLLLDSSPVMEGEMAGKVRPDDQCILLRLLLYLNYASLYVSRASFDKYSQALLQRRKLFSHHSMHDRRENFNAMLAPGAQKQVFSLFLASRQASLQWKESLSHG